MIGIMEVEVEERGVNNLRISPGMPNWLVAAFDPRLHIQTSRH